MNPEGAMGLFKWLRELWNGADDPGRDDARDEPAPSRTRPTARAPSGTSAPRPSASQDLPDALREQARARLDGDAVADEVAALEGRSAEDLKGDLRERPLPWFDLYNWRRDRIPPVTDRRTRLIDEGLIGAGLISAEAARDTYGLEDD